MNVTFHHSNSSFASKFLACEGEVFAQAFTNEGVICVFENEGSLCGFHDHPDSISLLPFSEDSDPDYKNGMLVVYSDGIRRCVQTRHPFDGTRKAGNVNCSMELD